MKKRRIIRLAAASVIMLVICSFLFGCGKKKRVTKETEDTTYGIDVARYQGTIDWEKVKTLSIADVARTATPRVTFYGAPKIAAG